MRQFQNLNDSVKKLSAQLLDSEAKNADLKDDAERLKRDLVKATKIETDLRRSLEEQTRIARECQHLRDQARIIQSSSEVLMIYSSFQRALYTVQPYEEA